MPFPCRSPAMPLMCLSVSDLSRLWHVHGRVAMAWWWHVDDRVMACSRLASLSPLLLSCPVPGSLLSEAYQSQIALVKWPVWNRAAFVMNEEKLIVLVQGHKCLYNLQHKDYDNSLSSVLMLRLHLVFLFSIIVCNNCFKFSNFETLILNCL
jgi:hypothetical protein